MLQAKGADYPSSQADYPEFSPLNPLRCTSSGRILEVCVLAGYREIAIGTIWVMMSTVV